MVIITTEASPPVAKAGPDQTVVVGTTVHLDGSTSSDADGDLLSYRWSLTALPVGSGATLSDPTAPQPTFVADAPGTYVGRLIVNDGTVDSAPDTVGITAMVVDTSPPQMRLEPPESAALNTTPPC